MNWASVFEWHKRFKEGRECVSDDERCGRSKEIRTPELIGQIKNFMDKDCHVSIETISAQFDVSVGTVHTIICEELKRWRICVKFVPRVLRQDQRERRCHDSREMFELIDSDPAVLDALVTCDESWMYCYDPETKRQSSQWKHAGSPSRRPDRANPPTNFWWSLFWQHWLDLHALGSHWTDSQQGILCWGFKGVQEDFPSEEASTLQIESVAFPLGQCTSPQLVTDYLTKMGIKTVLHCLYSPDLAPYHFWLFPKLKEKLRGCRYETIEEMKEAVMVIDMLTQEDFHGALPDVVGMVQKVHCSRWRLLRRELKFHVCTINKSAHTKKVCKLI